MMKRWAGEQEEEAAGKAREVLGCADPAGTSRLSLFLLMNPRVARIL